MRCFHFLFAALAVARPPHIFFVLVDDLGYNDVGWHQEQPNPEIVTPVLDELVKEGVALERHYVHPMCTPSRCSLQSGRLPVHVQTQLDGVTERGGIFRNMTTVATKMKQGGYATHYVGKWDAGMATPTHTPKGRGYDTSLFYFGHRNEYWTQKTTGDCNPPLNDLWNDTHPAWGLNGTAYEEIIFENAVSDIIMSHNTSIPLFLMYAPHLMHCPLAVPEAWYEKFDFITNDESMCHGVDPWTPVPPSPMPAPGNGCENCSTYVWPDQPRTLNTTCRRTYAAMINYLDTVVGNLTALIKQRGMWNDTLMVFTADNGGPINIYENAANNYPLRGGKYSFFEGGIRSTAFVSGGYLPSSVRGTVNRELMHIADWYATFSLIAGVDPTDTLAAQSNLPPIDSLNLWPLITGANTTSPRTEVFLFMNGLVVGNYKLLVGLQFPGGRQGITFPNASSPANDPNFAFPCKAGCLFDVINDPYEYVDLASTQPDIMKNMLQRLSELQPSFYVNNDTRHALSCPPSPSTDPIADCFCWTATNVHGGFLGPYEEL